MLFQDVDKFIDMILKMEENVNNFNYLLYYALYPDLRKKHANSFAQLLHHYLTIGVLEGRIKSKADFYIQYPLFDYQLYVSYNKDIRDIVEKKYNKPIVSISLSYLEFYSIIHYFTIGRYQGRVISNTDMSNIFPNPNGYPLHLAFLNAPVIGNTDVIIDYANSFVELTDANLYVIEDTLPDSIIVSLGNIGSVLYVSNTYPSRVLYSETVRQLADVLYITAANINNLEVRNCANIGNDFVQVSSESLFIAGNTTIDGNLTVNGLIIRNYSQTVNTMVYVNDESYIYQQNVNVTGNIIIGGNLYVDGNVSTDLYSTFYHGLGSLGYIKLAYTAESMNINDNNGILGTCSLELTEIGGSYVLLENLFFRQDYEWTIEFFVKLISLPGSTGTIIAVGEFSLELTSEGYLVVNVSTENNTSTTLLSLDTWYHIAVVFTGDTNEMYTLYINGDSDVTISTYNVSLTSLTIGSDSLSIAGYISEFRYSSCARYTESFTPPTEEFTIDDYTVVINHFNVLDDFFGYNFLVSVDMSNVTVASNLITKQFIHSSLGLDVGSNLFIDLGGNLFTAGNLWIQNEANFASGININEGNIVINSDGNIDFSGCLLNNGNLLWNATESIIYNVDSNVGIGTNTPEYKLDVIGDGNISGNLLVGNIIAGNLIVNDTIVGTLSTATQPYITSLGNITSLRVNGNLTVGNLITSDTIIGTLTTSAQPNITYLGSLSNLTVSGNAVVGNLIANLVTSGAIIGTLSTAAQPNITYLGSLSNLTVSGNAVVGNLVANLVTSGAIIGTLATSAQPNITSIGTLTSLIVNGDITTTGSINGTLNITSIPNVTSLSTLSNLTVSGNATVGGNLTVSGNTTVSNLIVSGNTTVSNLIVSKAMVGTLTTAAQPNITYVGTLSNLIVSGNATVGNLSITNSGTLYVTGIALLGYNNSSRHVEIASGTGSSFIDFHSYDSSSVSTDYDARIISSGGSSTTYGQGALSIFAGSLGINPATTLISTLTVNGATTLSSTLGVTGGTTLSTLSVTGATTLSSNLSVTGATYLTGKAYDSKWNSRFLGSIYYILYANRSFTLTAGGGTPIFGSSQVYLSTSTWYKVEGFFILYKSSGTASHTLQLGIAGSNISTICISTQSQDYGSMISNSVVNHTSIFNAAGSLQQISGSMASATQYFWCKLHCTIATSSTSTPTMRWDLYDSAAMTWTEWAGSYIMYTPIDSTGSTNVYQGTWTT